MPSSLIDLLAALVRLVSALLELSVARKRNPKHMKGPRHWR